MKQTKKISAIPIALRSPDIRYYSYPFPTGNVLLFGTIESLVLVTCGIAPADANNLTAHIPRETNGPIESAIRFLDDYLIGRTAPLPPLSLAGYTEKEQAVYAKLMRIGFGETITYQALAAGSGMPKASRFAGNAMAKNNFPLFIPCHRVIRSDGCIGNYSGGRMVKKFLLEHERILIAGGC